MSNIVGYHHCYMTDMSLFQSLICLYLMPNTIIGMCPTIIHVDLFGPSLNPILSKFCSENPANYYRYFTLVWQCHCHCSDVTNDCWEIMSCKNKQSKNWMNCLLFFLFQSTYINGNTMRHCGLCYGRNVPTTPLRQWGFWQCLPFSWTALRCKHCRHPIAVMGVVDTFRHGLPQKYNYRLRVG